MNLKNYEFFFEENNISLLLEIIYGYTESEKIRFIELLKQFLNLLNNNINYDHEFAYEEFLMNELNHLYGDNIGKNIVSIDGLIGIGKTNLLEAIKEKVENSDLKRFVSILTLNEPVVLWQNIKLRVSNESIMEAYYKSFEIDHSENNLLIFKFQMIVLYTQMLVFLFSAKNMPKKSTIISERSIYST